MPSLDKRFLLAVVVLVMSCSSVSTRSAPTQPNDNPNRDLELGRVFRALMIEHEQGIRAIYHDICEAERPLDDFIATCAWLRFRKSGDEKRLVADTMVVAEHQDSLWRSDVWRFDNPADARGAPQLLETHAMTELFLDDVRTIAAHGNPNALSALLALNRKADGAAAEQTTDSIYQFIRDNPEVVLRNWPVMRPHVTEIGLATTDFLMTATSIISKYDALCKAETSDVLKHNCIEIRQFLESQRTIR